MKNPTEISTAASSARSGKRDGQATTAAREGEPAAAAKVLKRRALDRWENEGGCGGDAIKEDAEPLKQPIPRTPRDK